MSFIPVIAKNLNFQHSVLQCKIFSLIYFFSFGAKSNPRLLFMRFTHNN